MKPIQVQFDPPLLIDGRAVINWPRDAPGTTCTLEGACFEVRKGDRVWRRHESRADGEFQAAASEPVGPPPPTVGEPVKSTAPISPVAAKPKPKPASKGKAKA